MRRAGVALEGPDMNRSEGEYTVERTDAGYAVRYALAGIRNVGEKAMVALVAERVAIESYRQMIVLIGEKDSTTRRILEHILGEEEEHADELADWLED